MVLTFPLSAAQFFADLPIQSFSFDLGEALETNETGAGEILTADIGARLWRVECKIRLGTYAEMEQIKAKLDVLRYAGRSLIVTAMPLKGPQYDPTGAILGASSVVLNAVQGNNRELRLGGLPEGYTLTAGDVLSFQYGSGPTRYAYHRVVVGGVADETGVTSLIEVTPFIRPGYTLSVPVKLINAEMKAVYVPGSFSAGESGQLITQGVSFAFQQTLR